MELVKKASKFLVEIKSIKSEIRPGRSVPQFTADILKARGLKAPVGQVKALPDFGIHRQMTLAVRTRC